MDRPDVIESPEVWKFTQHATDYIGLNLPKGSQLLSVDDQQGFGVRLDFWALVPAGTRPDWEVQLEGEGRTVIVAGTGKPIKDMPTIPTFLGSVLTNNNQIVWHVWLEGDR